MKKKKQVVFVVGFPGGLARSVTEAMCSEDGIEVKLLAPAEHKKEARQFAVRLKREIEIVEGSETRIDFGLTGKDYLALADEITAVMYVSLPAPPGSIAENPNARSASRELIELGLAAKKLGHIVALSHLDVAGTSEEVFAEWDLEIGQGFADRFQEDRFRAERVFRRFMDKLPITVARAGWVVGEGWGMCPLIHLLLAMDDPTATPIKDPTAGIFAVDVKTLTEIAVGLIDDPPDGGGRTLHLSFDDLPALEELVSSVKNKAQELVPAGFELFAGARRVLRRSDKNALWSVREFLKRQPAKARISTLLTERFLKKHGLPVPHFGDDVSKTLIARAAEEIVGFR